MKIVIVQHVAFEGPSMLIDWASERGYDVKIVPVYENAQFPDIATFDVVIILGGPMSVRDEADYAWLSKEKILISDAINAGKKVMGICLGGQLIAEVLGAAVMANSQKEIGWFPVNIAPEAEEVSELLKGIELPLMAFHWHGETFAIAEGAVRLFQSEACSNQAFMYQKHVLALQFHIEMNNEAVGLIVQHCQQDLEVAPYVQPLDEMMDRLDSFRAYTMLCRLLDNWLSL